MTEILVTNEAPAANSAPPPVTGSPAADAQKPVEGAPPAVSEADAKAAAALVAERKDVRELADYKAKEFRSKKEIDRLTSEIAKLQGAREADLARIKNIEELEAVKSDPDKFLDWAEKQGLTAQQLVKRAAQGKDPAEFIKEAESRATAAAKAEFERLQGERDADAKKANDERMRSSAIENWQKEIISKETDFPVMSAMLSAGPILRETVKQQAFRIYALAADEAERGVSYTPEQVNKSLEEFLAKEYSSLTQRKSASAEKPSAATGSSESAKSAAAAPNVTDARANDLATLQSDLPKDFKEWPVEKQNKWFIEKVTKR